MMQLIALKIVSKIIIIGSNFHFLRLGNLQDYLLYCNIIVPEKAIDDNGHVNNVQYLVWMEKAARQHSQQVGCARSTQNLGVTWVARSNWIEYFQPAFVGEEIAVLTWIANFRKVRSLRKYQFLRLRDRQILIKTILDRLRKKAPY